MTEAGASKAAALPARVAVLISGNGSNLQAIIDAIENRSLAAHLVGVLSNKADAHGLQRATSAGIPTAVVDHREHASRNSFDTAMKNVLQQWDTEIVVLAGFMRILTPEFVHHWHGRMLNIHPSLLPKYRGLHTHQRALDAGDSHHGSSVHFVTAELDGGPVVLQSRLQVTARDTAETLANRVQQQEHRIYPKVLNWLCEGRLKLDGQSMSLDGKPLEAPIVDESN